MSRYRRRPVKTSARRWRTAWLRAIRNSGGFHFSTAVTSDGRVSVRLLVRGGSPWVIDVVARVDRDGSAPDPRPDPDSLIVTAAEASSSLAESKLERLNRSFASTNLLGVNQANGAIVRGDYVLSLQSFRGQSCPVVDFRVFGARPRFNREKKAWGHHATVERLDKYHAVLVVRTGGAREIAR